MLRLFLFFFHSCGSNIPNVAVAINIARCLSLSSMHKWVNGTSTGKKKREKHNRPLSLSLSLFTNWSERQQSPATALFISVNKGGGREKERGRGATGRWEEEAERKKKNKRHWRSYKITESRRWGGGEEMRKGRWRHNQWKREVTGSDSEHTVNHKDRPQMTLEVYIDLSCLLLSLSLSLPASFFFSPSLSNTCVSLFTAVKLKERSKIWHRSMECNLTSRRRRWEWGEGEKKDGEGARGKKEKKVSDVEMLSKWIWNTRHPGWPKMQIPEVCCLVSSRCT